MNPAPVFMTQAKIVICKDITELSRKAAEEYVRLSNRSVALGGRFVLALSGGSTPKSLYTLLASDEFRPQIPWGQSHFFWSDERSVPPDHPDSNYRMAFESLLAKVPVPKENIHRIEAELESEVAAAKYERTIRDFFRLSGPSLPRFDLILLGLGDDGHTASLFPGNPALEETGRLVVATYVDKLKTYRITLTLPVLNRAANIFFLVAGESKAAALRAVLQRSENLPAGGIALQNGRLVWFLDEAAASRLQS
ncbi:MAG: 6-phosphogluconolactonase [Candidatus Binatia bacterium]